MLKSPAASFPSRKGPTRTGDECDPATKVEIVFRCMFCAPQSMQVTVALILTLIILQSPEFRAVGVIAAVPF
jgi:hypothetical protein